MQLTSVADFTESCSGELPFCNSSLQRRERQAETQRWQKRPNTSSLANIQTSSAGKEVVRELVLCTV